jgi:predicted hydrocarbon binding protein
VTIQEISMSPTQGAAQEVVVPVSVLASVRQELEGEAGTLQVVHALHRAGYQAGLTTASTLHREAGGDAFAMSQDEFWSTLQRFFSKRGWGTLSHKPAHDAVGVLTSPNWAEAISGADPDGSCCFSTGLLSGLLSQLAGGPVAVLEIECRTRGDASCDFAFGSEAAIHELYGHLLEGTTLEGALAAL